MLVELIERCVQVDHKLPTLKLEDLDMNHWVATDAAFCLVCEASSVARHVCA